MPDIYSCASKVLIYLGEEANGSDELMEAMRTLSPCRKRAPILPESIAAFLSRSWFHRVWMFQEVTLGRSAEVICGSYTVPWQQFIMANFQDTGNNPFQYSGLCPTILRLPTSGQQHISSFLERLADVRSCECDDPRDKVFALFGLFKGMSSSGLVADYSKQVETVYTEVAEYLITSRKSMDVLQAVEPSTTQSDLPSWAPDWRLSSDSRVWRASFRNRVKPLTDGARLDVGFQLNQQVSFSWTARGKSRKRVLSTVGIRCFEVHSVRGGDREDNLPSSLEALEFLSKGIRENFDSDHSLLKTKLGGWLTLAEPRVLSSSARTAIPYYLGHCSIRRGEVGWRTVGWSMFFAKPGIFGACPATVVVGDYLCKLDNTPNYYFLRRHGPFHMYVGECYGFSAQGHTTDTDLHEERFEII